jgi:hypothetical protein
MELRYNQVDKKRNITKFWLENLKGRDHLEDLGIGGKIILEWISEKYGGTVWTSSIWPRIGTSGGLL